jgi:hypothetical protein
VPGNLGCTPFLVNRGNRGHPLFSKSSELNSTRPSSARETTERLSEWTQRIFLSGSVPTAARRHQFEIGSSSFRWPSESQFRIDRRLLSLLTATISPAPMLSLFSWLLLFSGAEFRGDSTPQAIRLRSLIIGGLSLLKQSLDFSAKVSFFLLHPFVAHGLVFGRIRFYFASVQSDAAELYRACSQRQLQTLLKQVLKCIQVYLSEVRPVACSRNSKGYILYEPFWDLSRRKHPLYNRRGPISWSSFADYGAAGRGPHLS